MAAGVSNFYPVLPIFFVISLVLLILPVWGFVRGRNTPVLFYIAWLFLGNAIHYVDMLVWRGTVVNFAPVYCDIISVLVVMMPIGISCSLLCINILVFKISQSTTLIVHHTKRRVIIDSLICVGVPFLFAGLHVFVQNKRFVIVEDVGCMPSTDHGVPSLFIYYLPPSIICCCVTSIFCVRSVINFYRTRYRTNSLLPEHAQHAVPFNRYIRLILLCTTSFLLIAAFLISMLVKNLQVGFFDTASWASSTWDFQRIEVVSRVDLDKLPHRKTIVLLEILPLPILAFHFFFFFGIGSEAMRNYRHAFSTPGELMRGFRSRKTNTEEDTQMSEVGTYHLHGPQLRLQPPSSQQESQPLERPQSPKRPSPVAFTIPVPPPLLIPPPFFPRRSFLLVNDNRRYSSTSNPSSAYLVPSPAPSAASSRSSISVSAGHFPYPPPHFFHEHPYAPSFAHHDLYRARHDSQSAPVHTGINTNVPAADIEAGLDLNTGSTRSRFSVYSDVMNTPVQERRFTRVFTWGRRPQNHSI